MFKKFSNLIFLSLAFVFVLSLGFNVKYYLDIKVLQDLLKVELKTSRSELKEIVRDMHHAHKAAAEIKVAK